MKSSSIQIRGYKSKFDSVEQNSLLCEKSTCNRLSDCCHTIKLPPQGPFSMLLREPDVPDVIPGFDDDDDDICHSAQCPHLLHVIM